jgi:hypothetical protein
MLPSRRRTQTQPISPFMNNPSTSTVNQLTEQMPQGMETMHMPIGAPVHGMQQPMYAQASVHGMPQLMYAQAPVHGMLQGMQQSQQQNYLQYLNANSSNNAELQIFLDKFIEKMIYRILRYINKFYLQEIIGESDITLDCVNNIRKFIIYLWIIFSFHSNIKDSLIGFDSYKLKFLEYFNRWFKTNHFAQRTTLKSGALKNGYRDNQTLSVFDIADEMHDNKFTRLITTIELDAKLIPAIYNIIGYIRQNNYQILSIMFDSKYKVMRNNYNSAVKVGNFIVVNSIIINTNYGENVIEYIKQHAINYIVDITNHTKIENIYFDTDMIPVPIKIIDFIPVKQINNQLVSIYNYDDIIVADIDEENLRVNENISTEIKQYFKGIVYKGNTIYEHEFNQNAQSTIEDSKLQFPLYVIQE